MKVYKRIMAAGLMAFATSAPVLADAVTTSADFNLFLDNSTGTSTSPPIENVHFIGLSNGGRLYTNTFSVGGEIRTIGVAIVSTAKTGNPDAGNPVDEAFVKDPVTETGIVVAIFGIQGQVINSAAGIAQFSAGRIGLFGIASPTGFLAAQPETWGFSAANFLGEYLIADQQNVVSGFPDGEDVSAPASVINVSGANVVNGGLAQGQFLFNEVNISDLFGAPDDEFQNNQANADGAVDGIYTIVDQTIFANQSGLINGSTGVLDTAAAQTALNDIGDWAFGGDFATFGSGTASDFNPGVVTGDFGANLSGEVVPVSILAVPEPATLSLLALGGLGLLARRRRMA